MDLVIQGALFLFYQPDVENPVSDELTYSSLAGLQEAVDKTKYGGVRYDSDSEMEPNDEYCRIYKGPFPDNKINQIQIWGKIEVSNHTYLLREEKHIL